MHSYNSLLSRIKLVRRRWRSHVAVKGSALFLASAVALLILGVWGADLFGFRPAAIWAMRILTGATVLGVAWYFLYRPLSARLSDLQIAQYVEEKFPQLEDRLIAAVEYGSKAGASSGIVDLLIRDALEKTGRVDFSVFARHRRMAGFGLVGILASMALIALLVWGPSFFPYGFRQLYVPWAEAAPRSPVMIQIFPGDTELVRGSDLQIEAQLVGFDAPDVQVYLQPEGSGLWSPAAMEPEPRHSSYRYLLLDIRSPLRYYAEAGGVRSRVHSVRVLDLSRVETVDVTYTFPAYTGMAPQTVENEGDITALKGTRIDLRVRLSHPAQAARLLFDDRSTLDLSRNGSQAFTGSFHLRRSGTYLVQLTEARRKNYTGSSEYLMEALEDAPPKVTVTRPMRDVRATSLEEVFTEIKAEDDFGMGKLELRYSVNGGPEAATVLHDGTSAGTSAIGTYTFFLEEYGLQPGDLISYYGKAWDNNNATGPGTSTSDIYFIQVRPFEQNYTQNQQSGQAGEQGEEKEGLSIQQKEIISATFKLIRDRGRMPSKELEDSLQSLSLVQSRLQNQSRGLVDRLQRRGAVDLDENFRKLSEYLKAAIEEMGKAAVDLGELKPDSAMPSEQKALQQLMRAESLFRDIQVSFASQGSGRGGSQANAEDLADLFELEVNKLKNQYETVQRGEQQARDQQVDEAMERLKQLAQRQQQINERNRMMSQQARSGSPSGSGGQGQEQLMQEAEQLRRQLQRLSRERSSPQLNEAGNRMQSAIEQMKQALKDAQQGRGAEANAQGQRAMQQLEQAGRQLARGRQSGLKEGVQQATAESRRLIREQERIQQSLEQLVRGAESGATEESNRRKEDLIARKSDLAESLKSLETQLKELSRQARSSRNDRQAGNRLNQAAETIREQRLPERINSGSGAIQSGAYENQGPREEFIREGLQDVSEQVQAAGKLLGRSSREDAVEEAANRARQLSEGLEALQQRLGRSGNGQQGRQEQQQGQGQTGPRGSPRQGESSDQPGASAPPQRRPDRAQGAPDSGERQGRTSPNADGQRLNPQSGILGPSGNTSRPPAGMESAGIGDPRQLRSELDRRLTDARELQRLLDGNGAGMQNLERAIESIRRAGDYIHDADPARIAQLKQAIDYMRKVELDLARELERFTQADRHFFAGDAEAPAEYQKLVEEYYKAIARGK